VQTCSVLAPQCKDDIVVVRAQRDSAVEELNATEDKLTAATTQVHNRYYTVLHHHTVLLLTHEACA
jgi:hypothetical protein